MQLCELLLSEWKLTALALRVTLRAFSFSTEASAALRVDLQHGDEMLVFAKTLKGLITLLALGRPA